MKPLGDWRAVPGYEGTYEVSETGQVWSFPRQGTRGGLIAPFVGKNGYLRVGLNKDRKGQIVMLHQLVALAFHGDRPEGKEVCHRDDDKFNNSASNLYYGTHRENVADMIRNGKRNTRGGGSKPWTHCRKGHEYTPETTILRPADHGRKRCRTCVEAKRAR